MLPPPSPLSLPPLLSDIHNKTVQILAHPGIWILNSVIPDATEVVNLAGFCDSIIHQSAIFFSLNVVRYNAKMVCHPEFGTMEQLIQVMPLVTEKLMLIIEKNGSACPAVNYS